MSPVSAPRLAVPALAFAAATLVLAAAFEGPRTFKATELLRPDQVKGKHFTVASEVKTPGYFHEFEIQSDYGAMEAEGESLLLVRLNEIRALGQLDEVSKSEVFLKAAGESLANVGKGVASTVTAPEATAKGMGKGLKRFGTNLGRMAKRTEEDVADTAKGDGKSDGSDKSTADKAAGAAGGAGKALVGVNKAYRRWAQKVQVDPYTSNQLLQKKLNEFAEVDAAGSIASKVVVPIPMVVGTTASVGNLVWGKDPEELRKLNEQRLRELGVSDDVAKRFFRNKDLSLTHQTRIIAALHAVKARGSAAYVATAAETTMEREAVFFVESAEMMQRFAATNPVGAVLGDQRALVGKAADGRAVVFLPVDYVRWTQAFEKAAGEVSARAKKELGATKLELRMSGVMSDTAKKEMGGRGWTVVENVPLSAEAARAASSARK
jgi:hypothetical protein